MVTIRDIVILEGPDGAGKTTLKQRLLERFNLVERPRACTSEGGPVDELMLWVQDDLRWLKDQRFGGSGPSYLYDRYPLMSEIAYGPCCRGSLNPGFNDPHVFARGFNQLLCLEPTVIFCMPPKDIVVKNVMNGEKQMPGVLENIHTIYATYQLIQGIWWAMDGISIVWDYTKDDWENFAEDLHSNSALNYRKDVQQ